MSLAYDVSRATARAAEGLDTIAVVLALPGDSAESVLQRILAADTPTAYVIVSEDTTCFRRVRDTNFLRRAAQQAGLRILLVTADSLTVTASRWSGLEVVLCHDEPVGDASPPGGNTAAGASTATGSLTVGPLLVGQGIAQLSGPSAADEPEAATVVPAAVPARRRINPGVLLWPLVILLLGALAVAVLERLRVDVAILPPREPDLSLSVTLSESVAASLAFQSVEQTFDVQLFGNVTGAPLLSAHGRALLQNRSAEPVRFPAGSRFIATGDDGSETAFTAAGEIVVPGATRLAGTLGDVVVAGEAAFGLTAVDAGRQGNIAADSLQFVRTPDGRTVLLNSEPLWLSHAAFSGGGDDGASAVTQNALEQLIAERRNDLQAQADFRIGQLAQQRGMLLIGGGATSGTQLGLSTVRVEPPLGSQLSGADDQFTVTLRVAASARAVPYNSESERTAADTVFSTALRQSGRISDDECSSAQLDRLAWDGGSLIAYGRLTQQTACLKAPAMTTRLRLSDELRGLDQAQARGVLERYVADGVISGYQLPPVDRLPGWSWLIAIDTP